MEVDNRSIVNEEEVYSINNSQISNISYGELVNASPLRNNSIPAFKPEWQSFPEFQCWLRPIKDDETKAWCRACDKVFKADLKSLRVHGVGKSHARMIQCKFPNEVPATVSSIGYNVITDRKGTYGIGIVNKHDTNIPSSGNTLYVNPTNPSTNVLTSDPKQDKDDYVIVSIPKSEPLDRNREIAEDVDLHELQQMPVVDQEELILEQGQTTFNNLKQNAEDRNRIIDNVTAEDFIQMEDVVYVSDVNDDQEKIKNEQLCKIDEHDDNDKCNSEGGIIVFKRAVVTRKAPFWKAMAYFNGCFTELKSTDYIGKYLIMFFYCNDFFNICTEEIIMLNDRISEFNACNVKVVACAVDSNLTHQAWCRANRSNGGVPYCKIPLLSDATHRICKSYGCYLFNSGCAARATYIIDPKGIVQHITVNDIPINRNMDELLELIKNFTNSEETDDWK